MDWRVAKFNPKRRASETHSVWIGKFAGRGREYPFLALKIGDSSRESGLTSDQMGGVRRRAYYWKCRIAASLGDKRPFCNRKAQRRGLLGVVLLKTRNATRIGHFLFFRFGF